MEQCYQPNEPNQKLINYDTRKLFRYWTIWTYLINLTLRTPKAYRFFSIYLYIFNSLYFMTANSNKYRTFAVSCLNLSFLTCICCMCMSLTHIMSRLEMLVRSYTCIIANIFPICLDCHGSPRCNSIECIYLFCQLTSLFSSFILLEMLRKIGQVNGMRERKALE